MSEKDYSLQNLEDLWIKLWDELFNTIVEPEEGKETATVLRELIHRVNLHTPAEEKLPVYAEEIKPLENQTLDNVPEQEEEELKTLQQWNAEGRWIIKGEKAREFRNNVAVFSLEQTRPASERKKPAAKPAPSRGKFDDLEDDIPF